MTQFVIDLNDSQEKWDALYAEIAQQGESQGPNAFEMPAFDDLPHPYLWYLAIAHGPR